MAHANCSICGGDINTESSPAGKCVRCLETEAATAPSAPPLAVVPAPLTPADEDPAASLGAIPEGDDDDQDDDEDEESDEPEIAGEPF